MNDSENQRYCGTHGNPLDNEMCCEKCKVEWNERYKGCKDEGIQKGRHKDYLRHLDKTMSQKGLFNQYHWKNNMDSITGDYFCDRCEIVNWHQLNWCPKCGGKFHYREMKKSEFVKNYSHYKCGY